MTESQETFLSHLIELRTRLVHALLAFLIAFIPCAMWSGELYDVLAWPMMRALPEGTKMIATGVVTPFFIPIKVAAVVAFMVALPYILYQAWAFVAPGLYSHEKKLVLPLVVASTLLFLLGVAFCYFFVFGVVFDTIYKLAPKSISVAPDIENYVSFALGMFVAFGVTFEVPVVVVVLVRAGLVSVEKLREIRPYVIVGAFVLGAIFTPPDVVSQFMLAIPLWVLYELGIVVASMMGKPAPRETKEASQEVTGA